MTNREAYVKALVEMMGKLYLWAGKGFPGNYGWNDQPNAPEPYDGRDCSGTQTSALFEASQGKIDLRMTPNVTTACATTTNIGELYVRLTTP